jgi:beta-mannosidase
MSEQIINLNGIWQYKTDEKAGFDRTMRIPSNWEVAGLHDYSGVVWFKKEFKIKNSKGKKNTKIKFKNRGYALRFKGVDYFADVWLNGKYLGKHEGYFQPFEFNVAKFILDGENTLIVKVNSPKEDLKDWPHEKRYIKGIFGHHDVRPGSWSPKYGQTMGTGGIWGDVEVIETEKIRIKEVKVACLPAGRLGGLSPSTALGVKGLVRVVAEVENRLSSIVVSSIVVVE